MNIKYIDAKLPWTDAPVRLYPSAIQGVVEELPEWMQQYLPAEISLYVEPGTPEVEIEEFLGKLQSYLPHEFNRRRDRLAQFVSRGLFVEDDIEAFLTGRRGLQPWAIYYSSAGGLGIPESYVPDVAARMGVVPCSSMTNHGVAWRRHDSSSEYWLATAPKRGGVWDFDSDIGHESAHAAFAHVPLFAQTSHREQEIAPLWTVPSAGQLQAGNFARLCYMYSELAVVAVRGEERATETRLPVGERDELLALLRLSSELLSSIGFDDALKAAEETKHGVSLEAGGEIARIAAPIIRVMPYLSCFAHSQTPPGQSFFAQLDRRLAANKVTGRAS